MNKKEKGITLIALVITIIVLLILAGVSISMLTGENGILSQAQNAKNRTKEAENEEVVKLAYNEAQILNVQYDEMSIFEVNDNVDLFAIQYLANDFNRNFEGKEVKIMQDIDISGIEWKPIGNFMGTMDGQNHIITGLTSTEGGLFDIVAGGDTNPTIVEIKNLNLKDININTEKEWNVGGLVGYIDGNEYIETNKNCEIENCHVSGNIIAQNNVGGVVGNLGNCTFSENSFVGTIEANTSAIGGLIGQITSGDTSINQITNSYVIADIVSKQKENKSTYIGCLVGREYSSPVTITNCYTYNSKITSDTLNKGIITGGGKPEWIEDGIYENIYTDIENNNEYGELGTEIINKTIYLTKEEFKDKDNFSSFDFSEIWEMGDERPYLKSERIIK